MKRETFTGQLPEGWRTCFLDFETYYDGKYQLKKLTNEEYVRDDRFQALCAVVLWDDEEDAHALRAHELADYFNQVDWSRTLLVCHNAMFDGFILQERFGHTPARVACTLALARSLFPNFDGGYSLRNLGDRLVQTDQPKGYLDGFKGMTLADYEADDEMYVSFLNYCARDTFVLRELFQFLVDTKRLDKVEMSSACGMIRATTDPVLRLDAEIVSRYADEKEAHLAANKHLSKDDAFADALREHGIEPDTKMGARGELFAFAKTDAFMQELAEHPSEAVRMLHEGRLMAKSTSERTKARRFADIAGRGLLPVAILPNGAHTGRDSGGGAINMQNLKRGSPLRMAVMAREGEVLVVADSSQVECRVLNWIAGQDDVNQVFATGQDVYLMTGEHMFGHPITKAEHPELRQQAKIVELGSGYGLGAHGLQRQFKQGGIDLDFDQAEAFVGAYRDGHREVVALWRRLEWFLGRMKDARAAWREADLGELPVHYGKDSLRLPSGRRLHYPNLRVEEGAFGSGFKYGKLKGNKLVDRKVYGGAMAENVVQALARDIVFEADVRVRAQWERHGVRLALRLHDELVYACPEAIGQDLFASVCANLNVAPSWLQGITLASEGGVNQQMGGSQVNPYIIPDDGWYRTINVSGGRTSGFLLHQVLQANGGLPDRTVAVFANTGKERPETLDFIHEMETRWEVDVHWLEYCRDERAAGTRSRTPQRREAGVPRAGQPQRGAVRGDGALAEVLAECGAPDLHPTPEGHTHRHVRAAGQRLASQAHQEPDRHPVR